MSNNLTGYISSKSHGGVSAAPMPLGSNGSDTAGNGAKSSYELVPNKDQSHYSLYVGDDSKS